MNFFKSQRKLPITSRMSDSIIRHVSFIPTQTVGLASATTEAARQNPLRLILRDLAVLTKNLHFLPLIVWPLEKRSSAKLYISESNTKENIIQGFLVVFEAFLLILAIPAILILPGALFVLAAFLCCLLIFAICLPFHGSKILNSAMDAETMISAKQHESERWIFINGCITGFAYPNVILFLYEMAELFTVKFVCRTTVTVLPKPLAVRSLGSITSRLPPSISAFSVLD